MPQVYWELTTFSQLSCLSDMEIIQKIRSCIIHFNPASSLEVSAARRFFNGLIRVNSRLLRDPDFISLVENYLIFCNFCRKLAGAETLRDIECAVSGGPLLMYGLSRPMGPFGLLEAECCLRLNLFTNKDNISILQIYRGIDTDSVYPVEAYLIAERCKRDASLAPVCARILFDLYYGRFKQHVAKVYFVGALATALHRHAVEGRQESGFPINSELNISERDTASPVSLILGEINFRGPPKNFTIDS